MKFDVNRIARLAGLQEGGNSLLNEGGNRSKREDPAGSPLKSDKKGVSYDSHQLAENEYEEDMDMMDEEDEGMDPIMEARLKHIIQLEVESMIKEKKAAKGRGVTLGFAGPGFRR